MPRTPIISPRPLSSRVRGVHAPHVRTSLSPDLVLRRRRHILRRRAQVHNQLSNTNPDDVIEISSGSEGDEPPASSSAPSTGANVLSTSTFSLGPVVKGSTQPTSQASTICIRRVDGPISRPTGQGRPRVRVEEPHKPVSHNKSYHPRSSQNTRRYNSLALRAEPTMSQPWFRVSMSQLRKLFPELSCEITETQVICKLCNPPQPFAAGPGETLDAFSRHLRLIHF
ncbi:hypothetical protein ONZ51_g7355 [Trametes cubensis]|uniref:Uncharacterized protein n=1 Tax=Trametes cubensis TaxID=1111947 RepID=A0AAD7TQP2_9APHY|nr:hypothetical protein ONZ51_g7355 [Trametes cubensis]